MAKGKRFTVKFLPGAVKTLEKLSRDLQRRILLAAESLADDPHPAGSRKLAGTTDLYRIRIGDYRVIYQTEGSRLLVLVVKIGHRRDIYL
jgi:mRNA interferase RelE/StbE